MPRISRRGGPCGLPFRAIARYVALAYAISWTLWIPFAVLGETVKRGEAWPTHVPGLMGPMAAALLVTSLVQGRTGLRGLLARMTRWRVAPRWWLAAFSPLAFFVVAIPLARLVDGAWPEWDAFDHMNGFPAIGLLGPRYLV